MHVHQAGHDGGPGEIDAARVRVRVGAARGTRARGRDLLDAAVADENVDRTRPRAPSVGAFAAGEKGAPRHRAAAQTTRATKASSTP